MGIHANPDAVFGSESLSTATSKPSDTSTPTSTSDETEAATTAAAAATTTTTAAAATATATTATATTTTTTTTTISTAANAATAATTTTTATAATTTTTATATTTAATAATNAATNTTKTTATATATTTATTATTTATTATAATTATTATTAATAATAIAATTTAAATAAAASTPATTTTATTTTTAAAPTVAATNNTTIFSITHATAFINAAANTFTKPASTTTPDSTTRTSSNAIECLAGTPNTAESDNLAYWKSLTTKFYGNTGRLRLGVSNPDTGEKKVFELATHAIPHVYLANIKSGVNEVQMIWEQDLGQSGSIPLTVECPSVSLMSTYRDGTRVVSKGKIKATFTSDFKFDLLELNLHNFEEFIVRPSEETSSNPHPEIKTEGRRKPSSKHPVLPKKQSNNIPERVVNEFGVTHDTMRVLEVADQCSKMNILFQYSTKHELGATDSLHAISREIIEYNGAKQLTQTGTFATVAASPVPIYSTTHAVTSNDGTLTRPSASPGSNKRRTSVAISPSESGHIASPNASPAVDEMQGNSTASGMGTPILHTIVINNAGSGTTLAQGTATGLGLSLTGPSIQASPSMASPLFSPPTIINSPLAAGSPGSKSTKRVRTAPMTPTLSAVGANGNKGSASIGANPQGQGRSRKGSGRKDSAKRKVSLAEETGAESIALGIAPVGSLGSLEPISGSINRNGFDVTSSMITTGGLMQNTGMVQLMPGNHQPLTFNGQINNGAHVQLNGVHISMTTPGNYQEGPMYFPPLNQSQASMLPGHKVLYPGGPGGPDAIRVATQGQAYPNLGNEGNTAMAMSMMSGIGIDSGSVQGQPQDYNHWQDLTPGSGQGYGQPHGGVLPQSQATGRPGVTGLSIVDGTVGGGSNGSMLTNIGP
ncbi:hypothetical protein BGX27_011297 [Mortierella sp. AM989]|nr:hypothetical protein BGX27_011297 [Mortierella sp. AM989]